MSNTDSPLPVETDDDVLSGDEAQVFSSAFRDKSQELERPFRLPEVLHRPVTIPDLSNPLSWTNDRWTGDPGIDRQLLVQRAVEAIDLVVPSTYPSRNEMQMTPIRPSLLVRIIR